MYEVLEDVLPPEMHPYICCLSGPSFAKETALRMPTAVVVASPWEKMAQRVQRVFSNDYFRVYTSIDVAGVDSDASVIGNEIDFRSLIAAKHDHLFQNPSPSAFLRSQ